MKIILSLLFGLFFIFGTVSFAFQNQGFQTYKENGNVVDFVCTTQCILGVGALQSNNLIKINNLKGKGDLIIAVVSANNQLTPILQESFDSATPLSRTLQVNSPQLKGAPKELPIMLVFNGNFEGTQSMIEFVPSNLADNIGSVRNGFWKNDDIKPYSINLRYGIMLVGTSIVKVGYIIFILGGLFFLFNTKYKKNKIQVIFIFGVLLMIILGLRNLLNWVDNTGTLLHNYTFAQENEKSFFDKGDFITFTDKMRSALKLDQKFGSGDCKIMSYGQGRPFVVHLEAVYIKPCEATTDPTQADYIIYYHQAVGAQDASKKKLLEFNGSTVVLSS